MFKLVAKINFYFVTAKHFLKNLSASTKQGGLHRTNNRNFIASDTHRQPLAGKDSVADTKTLAETERSQLHPLSP